ncbi:MAG: DUF2267 domain-containing protein [Actinobacteria bacterium]|nr:MAG: DUF2267 domain-containing protein [Actinomycetota bacterium]
MESRIFYQKVQEKAELSDPLSARRATKSVLETLHWRLPEGEANDIEATLPPELQKVWRGNWGMIIAKKLGRVDKYDKNQFLAQVRTKLRLETNEQAEKTTVAVIHVLKEAIPIGESEDMLAQLPGDLAHLIKAA